MKVAILGFARDGRAAYDYFNTGEHQITVCDQNTQVEIPNGCSSQLGPDYLKNLDQFDVIIRSAGLMPHLITEANPETPDILKKVKGNVDLFFEACPTKNIIGVTGTKGKGTTCTLIAKMLEASGRRVHLGGNIGIGALDLLKNNIQPDDWVVLEQSSFQLIDQKHSPHIAVCLMVVPEHLDMHKDVEEYMTAKSNLFVNQTENDVAIYYADNENSVKIAAVGKGKKIPFMKQPGAFVINDDIAIDETVIVPTKDLKLLGKHNWQNVCAAVTAVNLVVRDLRAMQSVLATFTGLEHRLEFVRELDGVKYYDDSFGTTPETAIVAIEAFEQPKVVILGGSDKGSNYADLAKTVKENNVRKVIVIGDMAQKITSELVGVGFTEIEEGGKTMTEMVAKARSAAQSGDIVLLSTACASFGLFKDYRDRGQQFKQVVLSLAWVVLL